MFDLLKKKLSSFVSAIAGKKEESQEPLKDVSQPAAEASSTPATASKPEKETQFVPVTPVAKAEPFPSQPEPIQVEPINEQQKQEVVEEPVTRSLVVQKQPEPRVKPVERIAPVVKEVKPVEQPKPDARIETVAKPVSIAVDSHKPQEPKPPEKQRELAPKLGVLAKLKSVFSSEVTISEEETRELFGELEVALLESDVSFGTAEFLVTELKRRIVGKKIAKDGLQDAVKAEVAAALLQTLSAVKPLDLIALVKTRDKGKPFVALFVGPNGAGKTTTIAKIVFLLKQSGLVPVISASDTFRAAAIEQSFHHGEKLGVKVIRQSYGADPAAVAFDAIAHAKSTGADCVLIDTAGRQETNVNLVKEMEKINRVVKPDLKVFVGEAISGNALVEQVKKFNEAIGLDALVLTKLDCDAKGGNSLSIAYETRLPILFVGVGQAYEELIAFNPNYVVQKVLAA